MTQAACRHEAGVRPSADEVTTALDHAQSRTLARGLQWTAPRRRVYELLLQAGGPVKAYDLMDLFAEGKPAKPPTVYRALDFLEHQGLAHRIASINAFVACGVQDPDHAPAFLICDCCGSAQEFAPGPVRTAANAARTHHFTPRAIALEVRGRCARCAHEPDAAVAG